MDTIRWQLVQTLFDKALEQPPDRREAYLKNACADDADLLAEVSSLLKSNDEKGPIDRLATNIISPLAESLDRASEGRQIGPYRILRTIGRGGMGSVYLAERADGQFEQHVALKSVRESMDSEPLRRQFLRERQTLARLQHPGIARLMDGGIAGDGKPYFVMEYIAGQPIDEYCDARRLNVDDRLALFVKVCEAVQYAHRNLVVHRDLKPSNILVAHNGRPGPVVKLLDFGIARLVQDPDQPDGTRTITHVMTPDYAAPEQIRNQPVSTAADIYSLGVVLYKLLTGRRPYNVDALTPSEMEHIVCDVDPPRPSTAATTPVDAQGEDGMTKVPASTVRRLVGDLDTIVLKALQKEPEMRYASAEAFLEDIKRHLAGLPVHARSATAGYRVRKFVQRHRVGVLAAAVVLVSLLAGLAGTAWQAQQAAHERDQVRIEADKAEQALDLLVNLFEQADPGATQGEATTAREVLDRATIRLESFGGQPVVKATLLDAIGRVYDNLGQFDQAELLFVEALALRRAIFAEPHADLAASMHRLAHFRFERNDFDPADSLYRQAIELYRALEGEPVIGLADVLHNYASMLRGRGDYDRAESLVREALDLRRARLRSNHSDIGASLYVLAALQHDKGRYAEAEPLFRESIALYPVDGEALRPEAADARTALGQFLLFSDNVDEAEPLLREALNIRRRLYGNRHPDVALSLRDLGATLQIGNQSDAAEAYLREAVEIGTATLGANNFEVLGARQSLGHVLIDQERFTEAIDLLRDVEVGYTQLFDENHGTVMSTRLALGESFLGADNLREANEEFEAVFDASRRTYGDAHPYVGRALVGRGDVAKARGEFVSAESHYREALGQFEETLRPGHEFVVGAKQRLENLLNEQAVSGVDKSDL